MVIKNSFRPETSPPPFDRETTDEDRAFELANQRTTMAFHDFIKNSPDDIFGRPGERHSKKALIEKFTEALKKHPYYSLEDLEKIVIRSIPQKIIKTEMGEELYWHLTQGFKERFKLPEKPKEKNN